MTRLVGGKILGMLIGYKWELEEECFYHTSQHLGPSGYGLFGSL